MLTDGEIKAIEQRARGAILPSSLIVCAREDIPALVRDLKEAREALAEGVALLPGHRMAVAKWQGKARRVLGLEP